MKNLGYKYIVNFFGLVTCPYAWLPGSNKVLLQ